jgi:hypothetical protein
LRALHAALAGEVVDVVVHPLVDFERVVVQALGQLLDGGSLREVGLFMNKSDFRQAGTTVYSYDCNSVAAAGARYVTAPAGWSGRRDGCCGDMNHRHFILELLRGKIKQLSNY